MKHLPETVFVVMFTLGLFILGIFTLGSVFSSTAYSQSPCFEPVKTDVMKVSSKAQKIEVDLNGAQDLYLVATFGPDSYDCDQTAWANPVLVDHNGTEIDLTTLKPESSQTGWGNLIVNRDHRGQKINIAGEQFEKGLFAHAPSVIHFKLNGKYRRFRASVGLVDSAVRGSASFEVCPYPVKMPSKEVYTKNYGAGAIAATSATATPVVPPADKATAQFNPAAAQQLLDRGIGKIVFVRRITFTSNHVYTDHVNSRWTPGGGLAILDLKTGKAEDLLPELSEGVVHRFDISFDAKKIVFDYKKSAMEGYRIYEVNIDGTGLRQLTFPLSDEAELVARYHRGSYHHGTDDMQPCYLPDGGIAFVSTRCQFSVLCDSSDNFTVSNLYRINGDDSGLEPLTFSALNEQSPAVMPDGRILYHRWEYVDKAAGNVKALWAVNPDGTNPSEIYGNTITFPECMIYARPIPDANNKIVMLGASHCCPNNALGTVIVIDTKGDVRSPDTMTYLTNDVAAFHHNGFHFRNEAGEWVHDMTGVPGRLFKDPYPLSETSFLASCKPKGLYWNDPQGYGLVLLDGEGADTLLYKDESVSCWEPYPLVARDVPPVRPSVTDPDLAVENRAVCVMTDVYVGMDNVAPGTVKYLRVLEQIPRSWSARKPYGHDHQPSTHAHSTIGSGHLSVKVQLGIVPVYEDGSARFYLPADRAIFFQALDEKYRAIQTERTYVNFRPGETRSCVGCHETPNNTPTRSMVRMPEAMAHPIAELMPQPNQLHQNTSARAEMTFDYDRQIQPIWNQYCIKCHSNAPENKPTDVKMSDVKPSDVKPADVKPADGLDLCGTPDQSYCVSYKHLIALAGAPKKALLGNRAERNEDAAMNAIEYIPPYRTGALSSPLSGWLTGEGITLDNPELQKYTQYLIEVHKDIPLPNEDQIMTINNWLDANCPYHPSYFGRYHSDFQGMPCYRPEISPEEARSRTLPERIKY